MVPPCSAFADNYSDCALYLTPSWDQYACLIYCNVGYINVGSDAPDCRPCTEVCGLGYACLGGIERICTPCDALLNGAPAIPANAVWGQDCTWVCAPGYYYANGACVPCRLDQQCLDAAQRFMQCSGSSPGRCISIEVSCVPGKTFLSFAVYSESAVCAPCTQATPNVSFVQAPCNSTADAQLGFCTHGGCPLGISYMIRPCTLTANIQCRACSVGTPGQRMLTPCTATQDATFGPCPANLSCDGSLVAVPCPSPRIALSGVCVCPPGMQPDGGQECAPIACPQGWYPSASNCSACGAQGMMTLSGVMGLAACACPAGYFVQRSTSSITCWPCGDLTCDPRLQEQSACPGWTTDEPECVCGTPPGAQVLDPDTCTFACLPDYTETPGANMTPGVGWSREQGFFGLGLGSGIATMPGLVTAFAVVSQDPILVAVVNESSLWVHYDGGAAQIDDSLFIFGWRLSLVRMTVTEDVQPLRFWVGFEYMSYVCGSVEASAYLECSTVELVELSPGTCLLPGVGLCATLLANLWGNTMQAGFSGGPILSMSMDGVAQNNVLYFLLGTPMQLYQYQVYYYAAGTPLQDRASDPVINMTGVLHLQHAALAVLNGNFFMPGLTLGAAFYVPPASTQVLYAVGDHVLSLDSGAQVDIWNGAVQEVPSPSSNAMRVAHGAWASAAKDQILMGAVQVACPIDTLLRGAVCERLQCVKLAGACGAFSVRILGSSTCVCLPGYYRLPSGSCTPCPPNYYCSGASATPTPCIENALSLAGAWSAAQCTCIPGTYSLLELCLSCPMGFWCMGGIAQPIQCMPYASTLETGSSSPLDCICATRTFGLMCSPCQDNQLCQLMPSQPTWVALQLLGWGSLGSAFFLQDKCLSPAAAATIYTIPGPSLPATGDLYSWGWIIVLSPFPNYMQNITECMKPTLQFAQPLSVYTAERPAFGVQAAEPCDMNSEWSGTCSAEGCVCIAGYVFTKDAQTGNQVCVPCRNGSIRARRTPEECTPCLINNSYAPWMGMSYCICMQGFYSDPISGDCLPIGQGFFLSEWLTNAGVMVPLILMLGLICLLSSMVCSWLL